MTQVGCLLAHLLRTWHGAGSGRAEGLKGLMGAGGGKKTSFFRPDMVM